MFVATSRCLFMGKPSAAARRRLAAELERAGLTARLGNALFAPLNWHQSLSDRFEDEPRTVERLRQAGGELHCARAVRFRMDRIESEPGPEGVHWAFKAERAPLDFGRLVQDLGSSTEAATGRKPVRPTAHITISYWAPESLRRMVPIDPVEWLLEEVLLVRGLGRPYHYEVIDRWKLQGPRTESIGEQLILF